MCGGTRACGCFSICCLRADVEGDCSANAMLDNRECERCDTTEDVREDARGQRGAEDLAREVALVAEHLQAQGGSVGEIVGDSGERS